MIAFVLGLFLINPAVDQRAIIVTTEGTELSFAIRDISTTKIVGKSDSESLELKQVEKIRFQNNRLKSTKSGTIHVQGKLGARFYAEGFELNDGMFEFRDVEKVAIAGIPRSSITAMLFDQSVGKESWNKMVDLKATGDQLVVNRGGRLDRVEGVIKQINSESLVFESRGKTATVQLAKLAGIILFQPPDKSKSASLRLTDVNGNQFGAISASLDGNVIRLQISQSEAIRVPIFRVRELNFSIGRYVYLDDLKPSSKAWEPFFRAKVNENDVSDLLKMANKRRVVWTPKLAFGEPLMVDVSSDETEDNPVGRTVFKRGIAMRGGTSLVYRIPPGSSKFVADLGIQANRRKLGSVDVKVKLDGDNSVSKTITGRDSKIFKLEIPCSGERITISIDYGEESDLGDIVVLGNARFQLKK